MDVILPAVRDSEEIIELQLHEHDVAGNPIPGIVEALEIIAERTKPEDDEEPLQ